jgi:hypothetical protein
MTCTYIIRFYYIAKFLSVAEREAISYKQQLRRECMLDKCEQFIIII